MQIKRIKLKNYKMFENLEILDMTKYTQIIGKNDSGKSTVILAIKKLLISNYATKEFTITDSYLGKKEDIILECILKCEDIDSLKSKRSLYNKLIPHITRPNDELSLKIEGIYIKEDDRYESKFFINGQESNYSSICSAFKVIEIGSKYDYSKSVKKLKSNQKKYNKKNKINTNSTKYTKLITKLNDDLSKLETFNQLNTSLKLDNYEHMFGQDMHLSSNMALKDVYDGIGIHSKIVLDEDSEFINEVENLGDGRNKILTNDIEISAELIELQEQIHILLLEEPENHLFIDAQKDYLKKLSGNELIDQMFVTTHSPSLLKFLRHFSLVKLKENKNEFSAATYLSNSYLFDLKVAESCYSKKLLLVEGYSEEIFYEYIMNKNNNIKSKILDNNINIINVRGIQFKNYINMLNNLSIDFYIKTDNDFTKNKNGDYSLTGLNRALSYLSEAVAKELLETLKNYSEDACMALNITFNENKLKINWQVNINSDTRNTYNKFDEDFAKLIDSDNPNEILRILHEILQTLESNKIYVSNHFNGFEEDLLNFVGLTNKVDIYIDLKVAKAKNLEEYLYDENAEQLLKEALDVSLNKSLEDMISNKNHLLTFLQETL